MKAITQRPDMEALTRVLWAATLLTLPVTSFRYFPAGDGTYVRPLAFYPLGLLFIALLIQLLRRKVTLPRVTALTPLMAFMLVALISSAAGIGLAPVPLHGQEVISRIIRAWLTIGVGVMFFVAAAWMNRDEEALRFSIRWLLAGFILDILWSALQGATFYLHVLPKPLVTQWQRAFSLRELIRINRISGMAYEPSWLAGQITTIYLPWLFAALLARERVARFKWLEPCLLVLGAVLLLATFSRGGLLTAAAAGGLTLILVGRVQLRSAWRWLTRRPGMARDWVLRGSVVLVCLAATAGAIVFLGQKGYIARLWNTRASSMSDFLIQNSAGARAGYILGALQAYQDHPWLGVGLGASGFYIYQGLPDWVMTTVPEIARQLSPDSTLFPNPKNLYARLLAETGLIGFVLFAAFQFSLLGDALTALKAPGSIWRFLGVAAIFTWLALIVYNLTQDSLATPNLWINMGILSGMVSAGGAQRASRAGPE
jgi:O-antigen ligase